MKSIDGVGLEQVQAVYNGAEGTLWELIMGQQIHLGGFTSSMDLARKASISATWHGVDLCCCSGAGMRFLAQYCSVAKMTGVDATDTVLEQGRKRNAEWGLSDRIEFVQADATATGLPDGCADFVWGEDAWCYVVDKPALIREASRLVKPGGVIAFTDWLEGDGLTDQEAQRFLGFMKFANIESMNGYKELLDQNGCDTVIAENTGRFAPCMDLYLNMLLQQLTGDALRIIQHDTQLFEALGGEMVFIQQLAHAGKIAQGLFVAKKR